RTARDTPCAEIRTHLSSRTRSLPRRGVIRRHLDCCPACAAYELQVRRQRKALAAVLPVVPAIGLKGSVLGSLFGGGATVAGAGGGAALAGGGIGAPGAAAGVAGSAAGAATVTGAAGAAGAASAVGAAGAAGGLAAAGTGSGLGA